MDLWIIPGSVRSWFKIHHKSISLIPWPTAIQRGRKRFTTVKSFHLQAKAKQGGGEAGLSAVNFNKCPDKEDSPAPTRSLLQLSRNGVILTEECQKSSCLFTERFRGGLHNLSYKERRLLASGLWD